MNKKRVAVVRYEKPLKSVRKAVELSRGLDQLPAQAKIFIKPNIVFWTKAVPFPKWGVITTSRVVEDMIVLLKERGIRDITIGEGTVTLQPKDIQTPAHAFETLGYGKLKQKYGIKYLNVFERPFKKVDLGDGVMLRFNVDVLESDFVVDLPVMKAHNQTVVSLGIKNLKGLIDIPSRKRCHNMTPGKDLHFWVSKLADKMPPMFTLQDGIYTNERGPGPDGKLHRTNLLVASADVLSADLVGARILGYAPEQVPHLVYAAEQRNRPTDFSDIEIVGEPVEAVTRHHEYDFGYSETRDATLPTPMVKQGLKGVFYRKYDLSMCTYCSGVHGLMLSAIRFAWKNEPWDDVEILTGKSMQPTPGKKKTILMGKCIYQAHKDNPKINEAIPIKGCPPKPAEMLKALRTAGIEADPELFNNIETLPGFYMGRYQGKPEYDEGFFQVK
ncbi:MAG: DUF362 domain-containing protein [Deltaproteobacteria bacterium]|nr:DUF362 domain-containing protein [Deltaproteobacteria bacterium]